MVLRSADFIRTVTISCIGIVTSLRQTTKGQRHLCLTDLLADVIVKPDGNTRVVDLDELADAFERGLLSSQRMSCALRQLDDLLQAIYRDRFESLTEPLMNQIAEYESSQQKA